MRTDERHTHRHAAAAAVLLLVAGGLVGVLVDRLWLASQEPDVRPLTVAAMVDDLGLSGPERARVEALLDSMHPVVMSAAREGPDSLLATARGVHRRLEELLPSEARPRLRTWMDGHHRQMMERLHTEGR